MTPVFIGFVRFSFIVMIAKPCKRFFNCDDSQNIMKERTFKFSTAQQKISIKRMSERNYEREKPCINMSTFFKCTPHIYSKNMNIMNERTFKFPTEQKRSIMNIKNMYKYVYFFSNGRYFHFKLVISGLQL